MAAEICGKSIISTFQKYVARSTTISHVSQERTEKQLQKLWSNTKNKYKSQLATQKREAMKTGGGTANSISAPNPGLEMALNSVDHELRCAIDSDSVAMSHSSPAIIPPPSTAAGTTSKAVAGTSSIAAAGTSSIAAGTTSIAVGATTYEYDISRADEEAEEERIIFDDVSLSFGIVSVLHF